MLQSDVQAEISHNILRLTLAPGPSDDAATMQASLENSLKISSCREANENIF